MSGVGRDKPISITLFNHPSSTHIHPYFTHVTHGSLTRVVTSATVHHILCLVSCCTCFFSTLSFAVQIAFSPIRDNESIHIITINVKTLSQSRKIPTLLRLTFPSQLLLLPTMYPLENLSKSTYGGTSQINCVHFTDFYGWQTCFSDDADSYIRPF